MFYDYTSDFFSKGNGNHIYTNQYPYDDFFIPQHHIDLKLHYELWEVVEKISDDEMVIRCKSIWGIPEKLIIVRRYKNDSFEVEYIK